MYDIRYQGTSYREGVHIFIMNESIHFILGTKVKHYNIPLSIPSTAISQFSLFLNVMIFKVNFINFHDTNEVRQIILIECFPMSPFQI